MARQIFTEKPIAVFVSFFKKLFGKNSSLTLPTKDTVGKDGEEVAVEFLKKTGHRIIEKNWRCKLGEIDIISSFNNCLYFVEVKSSIRSGILLPEDRVNHRKQKKLRQLTNVYIKYRGVDSEIQFAIIAVSWDEGKPQVKFIENAF